MKQREAKNMEYTIASEYGCECAACGKVLFGGEIFCPNCGRNLTPETSCHSCGNKIRLGDKFCSHCGKRLPKPRVKTRTSSSGDETGRLSRNEIGRRCFFGKENNKGCPHLCAGFCTGKIFPTYPPKYQECYFCGDDYRPCSEVHEMGLVSDF